MHAKRGTTLTDAESRTVYIARAFAMLSVIAAHLEHQMSRESLLEKIHASFWASFGQVGVICFLVFAGFLYQRTQNDGKSFWRRKVKKLIIPWIICATATYLLRVVFGSPFQIGEYFNWFFGSGTVYYYVVVYLLCLLVFKPIYKNKQVLWSCVVTTLISLYLTEKGVICLDGKGITDYLNVLNWLGFFAIGVLVRQYWDQIKNRTCWCWFFLLAGALSGWYLYHYGPIGYFHPVSMLYELSVCGLIIYISRYLARWEWANMLVFIGKNTLCIYLVHIQIVQKLGNYFPAGLVFDMLRPFGGLAVMTFGVVACHMIGKKVSWVDKMIKVIGMGT